MYTQSLCRTCCRKQRPSVYLRWKKDLFSTLMTLCLQANKVGSIVFSPSSRYFRLRVEHQDKEVSAGQYDHFHFLFESRAFVQSGAFSCRSWYFFYFFFWCQRWDGCVFFPAGWVHIKIEFAIYYCYIKFLFNNDVEASTSTWSDKIEGYIYRVSFIKSVVDDENSWLKRACEEQKRPSYIKILAYSRFINITYAAREDSCVRCLIKCASAFDQSTARVVNPDSRRYSRIL